MTDRDGRRTFHLLDLVVSVIALGLLFALLMPRVGSGPASRRSICALNLKRLGLAMHNYIGFHGALPGYRMPITTTEPVPQTYAVSFAVHAMRYADHASIYEEYETGTRWAADPTLPPTWEGPPQKFTPTDIRFVYPDYLICPSDPRAESRDNHSFPQLSYVVNGGLPDMVIRPGPQGELASYPRDWSGNGCFFDQYPDSLLGAGPRAVNASTRLPALKFADFADGTSNTLMMAENADASSYTDVHSNIHTFYPPGVATERNLCFLWHDRVNAAGRLDPPPEARINALVGDGTPTNLDFARPSSYHPGGVYVLFCDGSARFIAETIDYHVYCLLMTPDGAESRPVGPAGRDATGPDAGPTAGGWNDAQLRLFRETKLDESSF